MSNSTICNLCKYYNLYCFNYDNPNNPNNQNNTNNNTNNLNELSADCYINSFKRNPQERKNHNNDKHVRQAM